MCCFSHCPLYQGISITNTIIGKPSAGGVKSTPPAAVTALSFGRRFSSPLAVARRTSSVVSLASSLIIRHARTLV